MKLGRKRSGRARAGSGFLCFSAVGSDADDEQPEISTDSSVHLPEEEPDSSPHRRRPSRDLAKVIRAASFISALKRISSGRRNRSRSLSRKEPNASDDKSVPGSSSRSTDDDDRKAELTDGIFSPSASSSASSLSSGFSSSTTPSTPPKSKPRRRRAPKTSEPEKHPPERGNHHPATGLFLLVITFSVMVIFGRVFAILWTATWLYFAPRRKSGSTPYADAVAVTVTEPRPRVFDREEKKRVVLEGLLERKPKGLRLYEKLI